MIITARKSIKHDGVWYNPGQAIELSDDDAKRLIDRGSAEASEDVEDVKLPPPPKVVANDKGPALIDVSALMEVSGMTEHIATALASAGIATVDALQKTSKADFVKVTGVKGKLVDAILSSAINDFE